MNSSEFTDSSVIYTPTSAIDTSNSIIDTTNIYDQFESMTKSDIIKNIKKYHEEILGDYKINEALEYIKEQRKLGKKIMLINGAVATQYDNFNIPENCVPIFSEDDITLSFYVLIEKEDTWLQYVKKPFNTFPTLFNNVLYNKNFYNMFDYIIFDNGTCYWMEINKSKLLEIFKYTFDNDSVVILENQYNMNCLNFEDCLITYYNKDPSDNVRMPLYHHYYKYKNIDEHIYKRNLNNYKFEIKFEMAKWFMNQLNDRSVIIYDTVEREKSNSLEITFCENNIFNKYGNATLYFQFKNIKINNHETINRFKYIPVNFFEYYERFLKDYKINESLEYINKFRSMDKKIMLINGAIATEKDKFNIPLDCTAVFNQTDITLKNYTSMSENEKYNIWIKYLKQFIKFPTLFIDVLNDNRFHNMFDFIIFNNETCYKLELNKSKLMNMFNYTFNDKSIIVLDNQNPNEICDKTTNIITYNDKDSSDNVRMPLYCHNNQHIETFTDEQEKNKYINKLKNTIKIEMTKWFFQHFKDKYILTNIASNMKQLDNKHIKITFSENNRFHKEKGSAKMYFYFIDTKIN